MESRTSFISLSSLLSKIRLYPISWPRITYFRNRCVFTLSYSRPLFVCPALIIRILPTTVRNFDRWHLVFSLTNVFYHLSTGRVNNENPNINTPSSPTSRLLLQYENHLRNTLARGLDAESYSLHTFEALLSQSMENLGKLEKERKQCTRHPNLQLIFQIF